MTKISLVLGVDTELVTVVVADLRGLWRWPMVALKMLMESLVR